jgi:photosystem II stability/assembly factor-like uncharacterized protein
VAALVALIALAPRADLAQLDAEAMPSKLATRTLLLDSAALGQRLIAAGAWGHVVLSDDDGKTWRQATRVPTTSTLTSISFVDERRGWAVGHDALILRTTDGGETWEQQHIDREQEAPLLSVWFRDAQFGIGVGAFGMTLETRDGGESWKRRPLTDDPEDDLHLNGIFGGPDGHVFIAAEMGAVYRSRDDGETFERLALPYEGSFWNGLALPDESILVFGMRGHVFRSEDRGETWSEVESGTDQSLQAGTQRADGRIVIVGLGGTVLTSEDGGHSFGATTQPDRRGIASVAESAGGRLLLFGVSGVVEPHSRAAAR